MKGFWIPLLSILAGLHQSGSTSDTTELIGAVGGSVTFHGPKTEGNAAFWSLGNVTIVTVVFGDPPRLVFSKDEYRNRSTVSEDGRALTISQLRMEDAGTYSVKINGKKSTFTLHVYKELTEPTVTCDSQDCSDSICFISLSCFVPGAGFGNISYMWGMGLGVWDEGSFQLAVKKSTWDNLGPLTCTAQNTVSSRNVTIPIPKGLCPGPPLGSSVGIGIGIFIGVAVVVILLVFLVIFCKTRGYGQACMARLASGSAEIPAMAGPGHWDGLQAMSYLGPEPGQASDQQGPEPGLALDQQGPEPGVTTDQHSSHGASGEHLMGNKRHSNIPKADH